jgi:hypothetical protein
MDKSPAEIALGSVILLVMVYVAVTIKPKGDK